MTVGLLSFAGLPQSAAGFSQINTSSNDPFGGFLNAINTGNQLAFSNGATPAQLDSNGYPGATLTSTQTINFIIGFVDSQTGPAESWVFKWTPTGDAIWFLNAKWSNIVSSGCTVSSPSTTTITMTAGVPARVTFTWTSLPGSNLLTQFRAAAYAANSPQMVLCRASDEAAVDAGKVYTPEYLAVMGGLNLRTIRTMPWINQGTLANTNQSLWAYRKKATSLGYSTVTFPPGAWGGTISGTNQYTVGLPSDSSAAGWTNGEVIQGSVTNASTGSGISVTGAANNGSGLIRLTVSSTSGLSTNQQVYVSNVSGTLEANGVQTVTVIDGAHVDLQGTTFTNAYSSSAGGIGTETLTVTGKTGGTKFISTEGGNALHAAFTGGVSLGLGTFVYNSLLDVVMWSADGITPNIPIEAQVSLANALNVNFWPALPIYAGDSYATSLTALVRDSLRSGLVFYPEVSNETWNSSFPQAAYVINMGAKLGISGFGFYSLRVRQVMEAVSTTWTTTRSSATLKRVIAWQAFGSSSSTTTQKLNSSELNSGTNAKLLAYAGSINYTTQGQRAVDFCAVGSYATYFSGAAMRGTSRYGGLTADTVAVIQNLANLFNANAGDPTALAILDNDFRQGTVQTQAITSVSGTTINLTAHGFSNGQRGVFTTTGALYSGVSLNTCYYVVNATTNAFGVSLTSGGTAISLSGGSGTNSFGILGGQTMLDLASSILPTWEQVAATYDAYRSGIGSANLLIECYEGGLEADPPTAAECTTLGVTVGGSAATASAALTAGLAAYKNSSYASALALSQFKQFKGTDASQPLTFGLLPHSKTPSWFLVVGPSQWSLLPGLVGSTAYQTYNGVASLSS